MQEQAGLRDIPFAADMPAADIRVADIRVADMPAADIQAAGRQAAPAGAEPDKHILSADKAGPAVQVPVLRAGPGQAADQV